MSTEKKQLTQEELMVQGAAWSTAGNFISRLLGVLYIIPWYIWMGQYAIQANALFNMGYNVYAYFLLISTTGLNVAIAKQVAKYNSMGQTEHSYQLIRSTLKPHAWSGPYFFSHYVSGLSFICELIWW
ncbi:export protein for polysaccharides and teichoic acids [Streptococcus pyogenes]|nr:export protein for polysaccharides and teichoic acids [Streptococcus pyogenes]